MENTGGPRERREGEKGNITDLSFEADSKIMKSEIVIIVTTSATLEST